MTIYLQAMCAECKRLFAVSAGKKTGNAIICPYCSSRKYSRPIQINLLEYLEVSCLYNPIDRYN